MRAVRVGLGGAVVIAFMSVVTACGGRSTHNVARSDATTASAHAAKPGLRSVAHAMVVAKAISAAHAGCDDPTSETGPDAGTATNPVTEQVTCVIGDDNIVISLFRDHASMVSAGLPYLHQGDCYMQSHQSPDTAYPPNWTYVAGDNWIVYPEKKATADAVASAIGGSLRTDDC